MEKDPVPGAPPEVVPTPTLEAPEPVESTTVAAVAEAVPVPPAVLGRPSEYDPAFVEQAYTYLERCEDIEDEFHKTRGEKSDSYERTLTVQLPTIEGLALYLKVSVKSLYNWADIHEDFLQALEDIKTAQKERLIAKGLAGDYNPVIAKLILSSNHDMRERIDQTSGDKVLPQPIINVHRDDSISKD